ncbi:RluA family pseudouridine synthase, partial [Piscinibacter sp.]|uniref:RluA family pseudouridine synthase n=1 Tax=Piscinibacter sp. TaxID=1903157 RepID=UPI003784090F
MAVVPESRGGKPAVTHFRVLEQFAHCALVECSLETGRTHQIRVHMAHAGHPIVGDPKYGDFERNRVLARGPLRFARMFLHAQELAFDHPVDGRRITLRAGLPAECETLLAKLDCA